MTGSLLGLSVELHNGPIEICCNCYPHLSGCDQGGPKLTVGVERGHHTCRHTYLLTRCWIKQARTKSRRASPATDAQKAAIQGSDCFSCCRPKKTCSAGTGSAYTVKGIMCPPDVLQPTGRLSDANYLCHKLSTWT